MDLKTRFYHDSVEFVFCSPELNLYLSQSNPSVNLGVLR